MRQVESSNLRGFEVSEGEEGITLTVEFKNGRTYRYEGVAPEDADALTVAADEGGSVGSVFSRQIRPAYVGTEVTD